MNQFEIIDELKRIAHENDCALILKYNTFTKSEDKDNLRWLVVFILNKNVKMRITKVDMDLVNALEQVLKAVKDKWGLE